jgi:8-oxo-dGTP pyrophosphatase MutT (NUDIX family)
VSEHPIDGRRNEFYVVEAPDWINVVAVTEANEFVLVRQYRHGTRDFTVEIPGGMVDEGETPLDSAKRELLEESGYEADRWTTIGVVEPNPAIQGNRCHTFLAEGARRVADPDPQGTEEFEVFLRPVGEAHAMVEDGTITHALVVCAFHAWARHAGRI